VASPYNYSGGGPSRLMRYLPHMGKEGFQPLLGEGRISSCPPDGVKVDSSLHNLFCADKNLTSPPCLLGGEKQIPAPSSERARILPRPRKRGGVSPFVARGLDPAPLYTKG